MPTLARFRVGPGGAGAVRFVGRAPGSAPFSLVRWFAAVSAVVILSLALVAGFFVERFLTAHLLGRDGDVMMGFINGIVGVEDAGEFFATSGRDAGKGDVTEFFDHLGQMPGVLRANAYGLDRTILWSTEERLVGRRFADNPELEAAFRGATPVHSGVAGSTTKREHANLSGSEVAFVENYLPIWSDERGPPRVIGVVEIYRSPAELFAAIHRGQRDIWTGAAAAAAVMFLSLFSLVLHADTVIRRQYEALGDSRTMAALGEMASAVAHSLRNPLASIRSSAELALEEGDAGERRELMTDVMNNVDHMALSIRQYLSHGGHADAAESHADLAEAVTRTLGLLDRQLQRSGIAVDAPAQAGAPVVFNPLLLEQVLHTLISNALEAMPDGGRLSVSIADAGPAHLLLRVRDTGPGMDAASAARAFTPFATTKRNGLGLGLPLARQIVARQGGDLTLAGAPGIGTEVQLRLRRG